MRAGARARRRVRVLPAGFVALRFVAGLSLANFVANQHWMSRIFAPSAVGLANAVAAGWANVGSAAAQVVMPVAYDAVVLRLGVPVTVAWRVTYLLPCAMLVTTGLAVLAFPYGLPGGGAGRWPGGGGGRRRSFWAVVRGGVGDYRAWLLGLTYGHCYGVELIMENVAADFFRRRFRLPMEAAGAAAACFGAMNAVARPAGGVASDEVARRFGMRGRLWALWAVQSAGARSACSSAGWAPRRRRRWRRPWPSWWRARRSCRPPPASPSASFPSSAKGN